MSEPRHISEHVKELIAKRRKSDIGYDLYSDEELGDIIEAELKKEKADLEPKYFGPPDEKERKDAQPLLPRRGGGFKI